MSNKRLQELFAKGIIHPTYAADYEIGFGFETSENINDFSEDCWDAMDGVLCDSSTDPDTFMIMGAIQIC